MITGRGPLRRRHDRPRACSTWPSSARPRRTRRSSRSTPRARKELPGVHGVFTGEDLDLALRLPMAWVPPGVEVKTPEHWPLAKGEVKYVGQARRDRARRRQVRASSTPPSRCSSSTTRCRSSSTPRRRSRTARRSSTPTSAPTRRTSGRSAAATWTPAWAEADVVIERRIVNHRTAGAPIEPRALHRRLPRRPAHAAPHAARTRTSSACSWPASSGSARTASA